MSTVHSFHRYLSGSTLLGDRVINNERNSHSTCFHIVRYIGARQSRKSGVTIACHKCIMRK